MTKKSIWRNRWEKKSKNLMKSTSLDFFAFEAFKVLDKYVVAEDSSILEIGSGTGRFCLALAQRYPSKQIMGIDYTDESITMSNKGAKVRDLKNVEFNKADLFKLPYADNSFDLVFENGVVEHFTNYQEALLEMRRVTKQGGKIIVNVNNWYCFPKTIEKMILGKHYPFGYEKSFKHQELKKAFRKLKLREVEVFAYNPANAVVRFFFFNKNVKRIMANIIQLFERATDLLTGGNFSRKFGYMTFAVGKK